MIDPLVIYGDLDILQYSCYRYIYRIYLFKYSYNIIFVLGPPTYWNIRNR